MSALYVDQQAEASASASASAIERVHSPLSQKSKRCSRLSQLVRLQPAQVNPPAPLALCPRLSSHSCSTYQPTGLALCRDDSGTICTLPPAPSSRYFPPAPTPNRPTSPPQDLARSAPRRSGILEMGTKEEPRATVSRLLYYKR